MQTVLVTGSAGFIGFHLSQLLLDEGFRVVGLDGMTDYYDVHIKERRHQILLQNQHFIAHVGLLEDFEALRELALAELPEVIVHLAAQAGVRYSLENPRAYINANIVGTFNVMECARELRVNHLLMASTSSVYGANEDMPFDETGAGRDSDDALRRNQEGKRIDGAQLRAPVEHPHHYVPLFYRLRPMGPARHGVVQVHQRNPER